MLDGVKFIICKCKIGFVLLLDYLHDRAKGSTVYGFRGGPAGIMKCKYVELTPEFIYPYRNQVIDVPVPIGLIEFLNHVLWGSFSLFSINLTNMMSWSGTVDHRFLCCSFVVDFLFFCILVLAYLRITYGKIVIIYAIISLVYKSRLQWNLVQMHAPNIQILSINIIFILITTEITHALKPNLLHCKRLNLGSIGESH